MGSLGYRIKGNVRFTIRSWRVFVTGHNPTPLDLSQELLARLSDIRTSGGNEADTRFKVIDDILTSILGWEKNDFVHEERLSEDGQESYLD
jgi:hypothetical protein